MAIFLVSDLHIEHQSSLKFIGREHFSSVEEMNQTILENWNKIVKPDDTVYNVGDVFFGSATKATEFLQQLNGHKLLIRGNHDNKSDNWYFNAGFEEVHRSLVLPSPTMPGRLTYIFTHIPVPYTYIESLEQMLGHKVLNIHGHLHLSTNPDFTGTDVWEHSSSYMNVCVEKTNFSPIQVDL